jgi:hypothetical protein
MIVIEILAPKQPAGYGTAFLKFLPAHRTINPPSPSRRVASAAAMETPSRTSEPATGIAE